MSVEVTYRGGPLDGKREQRTTLTRLIQVPSTDKDQPGSWLYRADDMDATVLIYRLVRFDGPPNREMTS